MGGRSKSGEGRTGGLEVHQATMRPRGCYAMPAASRMLSVLQMRMAS